MTKGDIFTVKIENYTSEGAGIARVDGMAVFVPLALRVEVCEIMILKVEKSFAYAKLFRVIESSPERVESECKYYPKCGGCTMWHMTYMEELRIKEEHVRSCIERIAKVSAPVLPIIGADDIHRYRNKAQFPCGGEFTSGFYRPRSHDIIPSEVCLIQSEAADNVRCAVHEWQRMYNIPSYDEKSGNGVLRHIYVRNGEGGTLVCLVVTKPPKNMDELVPLLKSACPDVCGLVININKKNTNVILGDKYITVWGRGELADTLCGNSFEISPAAFYQVNHAQTEKLYDIAVNLATSEGAKTALDLYCGIGTITLALARKMEKVIGVEVVPQAIENAKENAKKNGLFNTEFFCADAGEAAKMLAERGERPDAIVVDPPRKGISEDVISAIGKMAPKTLVYVSCDPATLARDIKLLEEKEGYRAVSVQPVDMFPRTKHVETVVLLSQLKPDDIVQVELNAEDLALTSAEAKATYEEIKTYVKRAFGFKVSSLYIAQVKQKMGLPMGKNYNVSKKGTRVPICPPEKEAAILEALKHYKMI